MLEIGQRVQEWRDPRVKARPSAIEGLGLYATAHIRAGEPVTRMGGVVMSDEQFAAFVRGRRLSSAMQVAEGLHLVDPLEGDQVHEGSLNHSCDSNLWMGDEVTYVARRDIARGEELTVDYALFTTQPSWSLVPCRCGAKDCRGTITGDDWRLPQVRDRYRGHFLPYLEARGAVNRPVPPVNRPVPPMNADERRTLESWLDFHRATLAVKCEDLDDRRAASAVAPPSELTLIGLVQHMAEVERNWFRRVLAGEVVPAIYDPDADPDGPDGGFDVADDATLDAALTTWRAEISRAREICADRELTDTGRHAGEPVSLRWIYVHMIEEYARHNGHADLIRERLDGRTGV